MQDSPQMGLVPDEAPIQELAPASPDPAFGNRVHTGRPDVTEHGPDRGVGQDGVECGGEVRSAVADHELDSGHLVAEVHDQVARLLGGPHSRWMLGNSENAEATGRVPGHGQNVSLGAVEEVGRAVMVLLIPDWE